MLQIEKLIGARVRLPFLCFGFLVILVGIEFGATVNQATAGGLLNIEDSWLLPSSLTRGLLTGNNHSSGPRSEFLGMVGQGRLFSMSELEQRSVSLEGVIFPWQKKISWAGSWQRTGRDLFVEDRLTAQVVWGNRPALGIGFRRIKLTLAQKEQTPAQDYFFILKAPWKWGAVTGMVQLQWPGYSSSINSGNGGYGRRTEALKAIFVHSDHAIAVVVDSLGNGKPNLGFQMLMTLTTGMGLEFRVDSPTGSLGPGLSIVRGGLMVRTSHLVHPQLGITHRIALVVGRFGVRAHD